MEKLAEEPLVDKFHLRELLAACAGKKYHDKEMLKLLPLYQWCF